MIKSSDHITLLKMSNISNIKSSGLQVSHASRREELIKLVLTLWLWRLRVDRRHLHWRIPKARYLDHSIFRERIARRCCNHHRCSGAGPSTWRRHAEEVVKFVRHRSSGASGVRGEADGSRWLGHKLRGRIRPSLRHGHRSGGHWCRNAQTHQVCHRITGGRLWR